MLIGSLVELYVGLHSCLCFSPLEKLFWKTGSTPPRHLLDTLLSVELLKHFFFKRNHNTSSIPGGSIKKALASSIASLTPQLSKTRSSTPTSTASSIPPVTSAIEHYWSFYIFLNRNSSLISSISLNLSATVHLPNTLLFTPNLFLKDSSSFFKFFYTW